MQFFTWVAADFWSDKFYTKEEKGSDPVRSDHLPKEMPQNRSDQKFFKNLISEDQSGGNFLLIWISENRSDSKKMKQFDIRNPILYEKLQEIYIRKPIRSDFFWQFGNPKTDPIRFFLTIWKSENRSDPKFFDNFEIRKPIWSEENENFGNPKSDLIRLSYKFRKSDNRSDPKILHRISDFGAIRNPPQL